MAPCLAVGQSWEYQTGTILDGLNLTPGTAISLPPRMTFRGDFSEEMRKKRQCSVRKKRGRRKQLFVECTLCQALHTYNFLVIIPSPWTTTLIFTRVKMEVQMIEGWMKQFAQRHIGDKEPNWNSSANQPPSKVHVLCTPPHLLMQNLFLVGVPSHIMEIWLDLGCWMNLSWRWAFKSPTVKMASFESTRKFYFFSFRTLILWQLVISPSLHRYLLSVPWQWKEGRKFCFLRGQSFDIQSGCWTRSFCIIWLVRCLL